MWNSWIRRSFCLAILAFLVNDSHAVIAADSINMVAGRSLADLLLGRSWSGTAAREAVAVRLGHADAVDHSLAGEAGGGIGLRGLGLLLGFCADDVAAGGG